MVRAMPHTARQIRSTVTDAGQLELSIAHHEIPDPGPDEVVVRIEAAPINPSDLGLLLAMCDPQSATRSGEGDDLVVTADIPEAARATMKARVGKSLPVGNEGAGVVVAAGDSDAARALDGKTVGVIGGATYSEYRKFHVGACLAFPDGVTPAQCASWFVNPMTALGMLETMRMEDHHALVHTAAASNLGQMLVKLCLTDDVPLVNIVRRPAQEELLRDLGARHVVDSSKPSYKDDLLAAIAETDATLGFDATGGGRLASDILTAMERAQNQKGGDYSRYGSTVHKQVYIYGGLDRSPTTLNRAFGMAWGIGGWLLPPTLQKIGGEGIERLRARVADEITTTFASTYTREVSLGEALSLDAIASYGKQATGEKFLITPQKR